MTVQVYRPIGLTIYSKMDPKFRLVIKELVFGHRSCYPMAGQSLTCWSSRGRWRPPRACRLSWQSCPTRGTIGRPKFRGFLSLWSVIVVGFGCIFSSGICCFRFSDPYGTYETKIVLNKDVSYKSEEVLHSWSCPFFWLKPKLLWRGVLSHSRCWP